MKIFRRSCILPQQSEREGGDWGKEIDCRRLLRCHRRKKQCIHENRRIDSPFFRSILEIPPLSLLSYPPLPSPPPSLSYARHSLSLYYPFIPSLRRCFFPFLFFTFLPTPHPSLFSLFVHSNVAPLSHPLYSFYVANA